MESSLVYEYSFITVDGLDHRLFSELCSNRLTKNPTLFRNRNRIQESWSHSLPSYISDVIYHSQMNMTIAIVTLILVERFQKSIIRKNICPEQKIDDAGRLWLVAYMIAGKLVHDEQPSLKYWEVVANNRYTTGDLAQLERQFYSIIDWDIYVDQDTFNECFLDMMDRYLGWFDEGSIPAEPLPIPPPPAYPHQRYTRNEPLQKPLLPTVLFLREEDRELIPTINEEDEALFARAMTRSEFSPARKRSGRLGGYKLQLFGLVLQIPGLS